MWKYIISVLAALFIAQTASAQIAKGAFFVEGTIGINNNRIDEDYYYGYDDYYYSEGGVTEYGPEPYSFNVNGYQGTIGIGYEFPVNQKLNLRLTAYGEQNDGDEMVYQDSYETEYVEIGGGFGFRLSAICAILDGETFFGPFIGLGTTKFTKTKKYEYDYYEYDEALAYGSSTPVSVGTYDPYESSGSVKDSDRTQYWEIGAELGHSFMDGKMDGFVRAAYRDYGSFDTKFESDYSYERHEFDGKSTMVTVGLRYRFGKVG